MRYRPRVDLYRTAGKRCLDVTVACASLPLAVPLMAVIAIMSRVALGRGIWYRQRRIGLNGQPFTVLKFRTMEPDRRDLPDAPPRVPDRRLTHKTVDDPRHTNFGRALRRTGLDELPQLVNVLRGEMSLVGPRPELPVVVSRYSQWQHARHDVRPGITGLWQISARGTIPMHEAVGTDLDYIRTVSLRGDLKILVQTIPAMMRRSGA
jgi:lipopolysaccharide/colanic/teichoic acid biosynthesis glycosyltransferase